MNMALELRNCWINGRTLRNALNHTALNQTEVNHSLSSFRATDRVAIDTQRDALLLGSGLPNPFPFCTGNSVMATVLDVNTAAPQIYEFGLFQCTASAFDSSLYWIRKEDTATEAVEAQGRKVLAGAWSECYEFSHQVCEWGRGGRVWGNLNRHSTADALQIKLCNWFSSAVLEDSDSNAIEGGCGIKGLGVSFASKHLRLLLPERYAVLDEVLSTGLGFALNPTGYALFMREIKRFKEKYSIRHSLAHIEWAIFGLVRQSVRGLPPSSIDITKNQTY